MAAIAVLTALSAVQHWFIPAVAALFAFGPAGAFLFVPQQNRVFTAGGDLAPVALALNGSMNYLGAAIGAAAGGVVLAAAGATWLAPAGIAAAAAVLAVTRLTAPEHRPPARNAATKPADDDADGKPADDIPAH
jgi:predicted MFS family arabinose efflux permease